MLLSFYVELPPTQVLQVVDPVAKSDRDQFPRRRCAPHPSGRGLSCTEVQPGNPYQVLLTWLTR